MIYIYIPSTTFFFILLTVELPEKFVCVSSYKLHALCHESSQGNLYCMQNVHTYTYVLI